MCGFYDDEQKMKKGDIATLNGENITIISAKHIKENRTMDIVYQKENNKEELKANIPYQTSGFGFELVTRA